jgi:hypothetical protein
VEKLSTYAVAGIPEGLATTFVLICLSLSLAPWLGGVEIGPLKVPKFSDRANRWIRVAAPLAFMVFALGFLKIWPSGVSTEALTYDEYLSSFFIEGKKNALREACSYLMS